MRIVRLSARFLLTVAAAAMLSACSSSLERFSAENTSYDNPSDSDPVYTAAIQKPKQRFVKTTDTYQAPQAEALIEETPITSRPLAKAAINKPKLAYDYSNAYQKKPAYKQPKLTMSEAPVDREPAYEAVEEPLISAPVKKISKPKLASVDTSSAKPAIVPKSGRIRVQPGMTLANIAKSNGVSVEELAQANGLKKPYWVSAGTVLLVPGVVTPTAPRTTLQSQKQQVDRIEEQDTSLAAEEEIQAAPKKKVVAASGSHTVSGGETLYSLGRKFGVSPFAIAEANGLERDTSLSVGQHLKIPGSSAKVAAAPKLTEKPTQVAEETIGDEEPQVFAKPKKKLTLDEEPKAKIAKSTPVDEEPVVEEKIAEAPVKKELKLKEPKPEAVTSSAQSLALRWPVRGKVISDYGPKTGGLKNEGINISVPEGTSIRAAESGVVAYAGNELKGYGNLILIRHDGGYVTAYAHAKELIVKRGDKVNRGDVIAKAGQTGAVSSPQVHFEVRKGASALNPNKFLGSSTAMN